jgi:hypothetical protein
VASASRGGKAVAFVLASPIRLGWGDQCRIAASEHDPLFPNRNTTIFARSLEAPTIAFTYDGKSRARVLQRIDDAVRRRNAERRAQRRSPVVSAVT